MSIEVGEANSDDPKGNGFKFIVSSKEWLTEYGAAGSFDGDYRGVPGSDRFYPLLMGCESGRYRITADLAAKRGRIRKNVIRLPARYSLPSDNLHGRLLCRVSAFPDNPHAGRTGDREAVSCR